MPCTYPRCTGTLYGTTAPNRCESFWSAVPLSRTTMKYSTKRSKTASKTVTRLAVSALLLVGTFLPNKTISATQYPGSNKAVSPRISALEREVKAGNLRALDQFWESVTRDGAPIVESLPSDSKNALVTFVWRAKQDTSNVVVFALR